MNCQLNDQTINTCLKAKLPTNLTVDKSYLIFSVWRERKTFTTVLPGYSLRGSRGHQGPAS